MYVKYYQKLNFIFFQDDDDIFNLPLPEARYIDTTNVGTLDSSDVRILLFLDDYWKKIIIGGSREAKQSMENILKAKNDPNLAVTLYERRAIPRKVFNTIESLLSNKSEPHIRRAWKVIIITTILMMDDSCLNS